MGLCAAACSGLKHSKSQAAWEAHETCNTHQGHALGCEGCEQLVE